MFKLNCLEVLFNILCRYQSNDFRIENSHASLALASFKDVTCFDMCNTDLNSELK